MKRNFLVGKMLMIFIRVLPVEKILLENRSSVLKEGRISLQRR